MHQESHTRYSQPLKKLTHGRVCEDKGLLLIRCLILVVGGFQAPYQHTHKRATHTDRAARDRRQSLLHISGECGPFSRTVIFSG